MTFSYYGLIFVSNLNISGHIEYIFLFPFVIGVHFTQGLSGQPLSGPDIGGFAGNATPRLFGRWVGVGSLFPFCRGHSEAGTADHEPWSFGEEVGSSLAVYYQ